MWNSYARRIGRVRLQSRFTVAKTQSVSLRTYIARAKCLGGGFQMGGGVYLLDSSDNPPYQTTQERGVRGDYPSSISYYTRRRFLGQAGNGAPARDSRKWRRARRNPAFARFVDVGIDCQTDTHGDIPNGAGNAQMETRTSSELTRNFSELRGAPRVWGG